MHRTVAIGSVLLLVASSACSNTTNDDAIEVVAGFYPLAEIAARIGGPRVLVTNLTEAGAEPHDLEPTTRDLERIHTADLILYLGRGFQPALERTAKVRPAVALDLLEGLPLRTAVDASGRQREGPDPHVWLDPVRMLDMIDVVLDRLTTLSPEDASNFEARAQEFATSIDALHARFEKGLSECDTRVIVTSHAAFGYLASRYRLKQEPIAGVAPESEPNPRRLAALDTLVERLGITTIFTETLVSPRVAETLAREAGVRTAVLNPLEGLTDEETKRGEGYVTVMSENLATLRTALGCR